MTKNIGFPKTLIFVHVTTSMKGNILTIPKVFKIRIKYFAS